MSWFKTNWSKWEISEKNVRKIKINSNPILGLSNIETVFVDVLKRKNLKTGKIQYKKIER
jgi:hypothetical protein